MGKKRPTNENIHIGDIFEETFRDECGSSCALYREVLPGVSDRTRQRDFQELEKLGYSASYSREWPDEPGRWYYEIPGAYGLRTMPEVRW